MHLGNPPVAAALLAASFAVGGPCEAADADQALQVYREFVEVRGKAEFLDELYPFLRAGDIDQLRRLPEDTAKTLGERILEPPGGGQLRKPGGAFDLALSRRDGEEMVLVLESSSEDNGVRETLRLKVRLTEEADGWKIANPTPASWRLVGRMPTEMQGPEAPRKPGPGATQWKFEFSGRASDLNLIAEAVITQHNSAVDDYIRWDPQGNFLAVGDVDGATYLSIPDLKTKWVLKARTGVAEDGAISADSRWQIIAPGSIPAFLPLSFSLEQSLPSGEYYFREPVYAAIAGASGRQRVRSVHFHPSEPLLAIVNQGRDGHAIFFQPTQGLIEGDVNEGAPEQWSVDVEPTRLAWSADGNHLAFVRGYSSPGAEVEVRTYPAGETVGVFASKGFAPGVMHFSPGGERLFITGGDMEGFAGRVWDIFAAGVAGDFRGVRFGAWVHDNRHLLAVKSGGVSVEAGVDDVIQILGLETGDSVASITAFPRGNGKYPSQIRALGVSPNGRFLAAVAETTSSEGDDRFLVKLWQIGSE